MSEHDLFASFDRPAFESPEMLIARLSPDELNSKHAELIANSQVVQHELEEARRVYDEKLEAAKELRADISAIQHAIQLSRDKGLE